MSIDPQQQQRTGSAPPEQPFRAPEVVTGTAATKAKPDLQKRAIAAIIDCVAAVLVGMIPVIGGLIATAYWLVRDGLNVEFMPNRSLGKKVMGLQPVTLDGGPVDIPTSIRRNWPLAFAGILQIVLAIPFVGWVLVLLLAVPVGLVALGLGLMETYLVITSEDGRRFGDKFAKTKVIEVSTP